MRFGTFFNQNIIFKLPNFCLSQKALIIILCFLLTACDKKPHAAFSARPVQYVTIKKLQSLQQIQQTGEIMPHRDTPLSFRIDGRILKINVDIGDKIHAGQILASLDPIESEHQLASAKANLDDAIARSLLAKKSLNRMLQLANSGAISSTELDQTKTNDQSAYAKQKDAAAALKSAQDHIAYNKLIAPHDGIVLSRSANVGQTLLAGQQVLTIASGQTRDAIFQVTENELNTWQNASHIKVQLLHQPDLQAQATLRDISPQADPQTRTWRVRVTLQNPPDAMRLGATVQVTTNSLYEHPAIFLSSSALTRSQQNPAVFLITPQQTLKLQAIKIDHFTASEIVISSGLKIGDRVVTAGVNQLFSGEKVTLQDAF